MLAADYAVDVGRRRPWKAEELGESEPKEAMGR